jgi:hypothetical protein
MRNQPTTVIASREAVRQSRETAPTSVCAPLDCFAAALLAMTKQIS